MCSTKIRWPAHLRPGDCPVYAYNELQTAVDPGLIWTWLVHAPLWPTWYGNCQDLRIVSGPADRLALGTRFNWKAFGLRVDCTVAEFEPQSRLAWRGTAIGGHGYHGWFIEPHAGGCTVITEETERGPVPSLARAILRPAIHREHQRWLEDLARMAASGLPPG